MKRLKKHKLFGKRLLEWHNTIDRQMPWKQTREPYKIWISEIVLQQTRVEQGWNYYVRLIEKFPTVQDMAGANEDEILAAWKGLGYYSRARNMHYAAKQIVHDFGGVFPNEYDQIISLKGVGVYSAAAIGSFAFDLPLAVVDGNVYRVLSRFFNITTPIDSTSGKREFAEIAHSCLISDQSASYNQAIMDFGATLCKPRKPNCLNCPLQDDCLGLLKNTHTELPVKKKKIKVKKRFFNYLVYFNDSRLYLTKRSKQDIWQRLYEFPLLESKTLLSKAALIRLFKKHSGPIEMESINIEKVSSKKQKLTHQIIHGSFYLVNDCPPNQEGEWKTTDEIANLGLPKMLDDFIKEFIGNMEAGV